ncbi:hypothetical protein N7516_009485 [Penicillium verrucosum]|uniref:uncharacterized protein n=1 Tax=Penicillium verrucosum TaxID=60171 RepID=UPI002544D98B|nr:uncharacterized protein N7516_009485 [Penicillium verrucosum]KAJ5921782.1 hypothetical protein N7516_009485 [Penicillium verrucosum]
MGRGARSHDDRGGSPPPKPKGQVCETRLIRWEKNHVNQSLAEAVSGKTDWKGRESQLAKEKRKAAARANLAPSLGERARAYLWALRRSTPHY